MLKVKIFCLVRLIRWLWVMWIVGSGLCMMLVLVVGFLLGVWFCPGLCRGSLPGCGEYTTAVWCAFQCDAERHGQPSVTSTEDSRAEDDHEKGG